jgi:hypothetical protein
MSQPATQPAIFDETQDFSLVLGGPLFQLFRKAHLAGDHLQLLYRRIIFITAVTWLPLFLLSTLRSSGGSLVLSFVRDIDTHVRLLVALPVLIAAELIVHLRLRVAVQGFTSRNIIVGEDVPKLRAAVESAMRLRNLVPLEVALIILVFTVGQWVWWKQIALNSATWYAVPEGEHIQLTAAGYWNAFVSVPIFQFILLRWYLRLLIWIRLLWQVSRLHLHLIASHPDRAGGLSFLGLSSYAFAPILFAQGCLLSGVIGSRVLYAGENLMSFKVEAIGLVVLYLIFILGPLTIFTPQLVRARREGLAEYGVLANQYVAAFEKKWVKNTESNQGELLGSGDIQSLADLGNSYEVIREMRPVPFNVQDITRLAAATAAPLLPLGLTVFSLEELVTKLLKVLF